MRAITGVITMVLSCTLLLGCEGLRMAQPTRRPVYTTTSRPRPTNLACPRAQTFFPTTRTEPTCTTVDTCARDELCCQWFRSKHCLTGIVTTPKDGQCPVGTVNKDEPCRQDFVGCQFDSECRGDQKCCRNINCGYNQCQAPATPRACTKIGCSDTAGPDCKNVELIQPNGPECAPICRVCRDPPAVDPRKNLACPSNPFFFPITDTDSAPCSTNSDCESDELCCFFGTDDRCKKGLNTILRPGVCPVEIPTPPGEFVNCIADFVGCQFDSECSGTQKCCRNSECGYSECRPIREEPRACTEIGCVDTAGPDCKNVEIVRPNGPGCEPACRVCRDPTPPPRPCTRRGCGSQAGPECLNVELVRPNGPGCEPECRVCKDPPRACTLIGCVDTAGPDCQNVETFQPNGPGCAPVCRVCRDEPTPVTRKPGRSRPLCRRVPETRCYGSKCRTVQRVRCDGFQNSTPRY